MDRTKRSQTAQAAEQVAGALREGTLVILFPEGTSSGGETVLPFKSSLLEPAASNPHALTAASISYEVDDGDVSEEVCYWKDMTLVPHLVNLLSKHRVHAELRFVEIPQQTTDRKILARQLHSQVVRLKAATYPLVGSSESTHMESLIPLTKADGLSLPQGPHTVSKNVSKGVGKVLGQVVAV